MKDNHKVLDYNFDKYLRITPKFKTEVKTGVGWLLCSPNKSSIKENKLDTLKGR